ncbi:MAG: hypothetical protein HQ518_32150 [Rhodopirellula sp.]|nr:hypothetical protein [Rhodopirellula sp.]
MRPNLVSSLIGTVFALMALTAAGCGGGDGLNRVAVSGSVTLDGKAAPHGIIRFVPAPGTEGPVANTMISNGQYNIPRDQGPVPGNYEVRVHAYEDPNADSIAYPTARMAPIGDDQTATKNPLAEVKGDHSTAASSNMKQTFNITIPELSSFAQDFAL